MLLSSIITNFKIVIKNMFIPQKFLKAVLIIGPGFPGSSKDLEVLKSIYNREGYLIIGDGDREGYITDDQIKALKGQINSKTRIDVYVHGGKVLKVFYSYNSMLMLILLVIFLSY